MPVPYSVILAGAPGLSAPDRIAAECRVAGELERLLGGADGVQRAYLAADGILEAWATEEAGPDDEPPVTPWDKALATACEAGWQGLQRPVGAAFEVRWASGIRIAAAPTWPAAPQVAPF